MWSAMKDDLKYAQLTEVQGRWQADIIESFLRSEEIDSALIQDAVTHLTHANVHAPVQILVPKVSFRRARNLLQTFNESQEYEKDETAMANKKKIEDRIKERQAEQTERTIRTIGIAVVVLIVLVIGYLGITNLQAGAPEATEPGPKQYAEPPPMTIDPTKTYLAQFTMENGGEFTVQLFADKAPITVNNFVFLARDGFYDGLTFHRVMEGFMAQGGDPLGTGAGDPGYSFEDEFSDLMFDRAGLLAMANSGPNTNGSQFFITFDATPHLNNLHTIFGEVIDGMDVVNAITRREPGSATPADAIETITIIEE
jgi:cyclophilin family peptidyl-prolyl cis-trans isomerase